MKQKSHIPREKLQTMFEGIGKQTEWDIAGDMLWGYFFCDTRPDRLQVVRRKLEAEGYRFVELFEIERDGKNTGQFMLHVERIERHTVDSLDSRNGELDALAAQHGLLGYDGMDVGPVRARP